ncbi:MAG: hypothetical protein ACE5EK_05190 [Nitrospinales bacterium]
MTNWQIRLVGIGLFLAGGALFVWAVKYMTSEWPQIFAGILSIFFMAMGFGLSIMPLASSSGDSESVDK